MTPFGHKMRDLRTAKQVTQKDMAKALGVSAAYLSALEHGNRGRPGPGLIMQICEYFGLIWDQADDLKRLARLSHPRVDRKSTRLNSSHITISYAVFCLKKKKTTTKHMKAPHKKATRVIHPVVTYTQ